MHTRDKLSVVLPDVSKIDTYMVGACRAGLRGR